MNPSFVLQAARSAALLGACASLFAFDASASGRLATAPGSMDSTNVTMQAPTPATTSPWVYLGPQKANVKRLVLSPHDPGRLVAILSDFVDHPLAWMVYASDSAGDRWVARPPVGQRVEDAAFAAQRDLLVGINSLWSREQGNPEWDEALHPEHGQALFTERVAVGSTAGSPAWVTGRLVIGASAVNRVFRLSSDLQAWTDVTPALPGRRVPVEVAVSNTQPGHVAVATVDYPARALRVFVSGDDGASWTASTPPSSLRELTTLRWIGGHLFAGGISETTYRAELWSSADNGATWHLLFQTDSYWSSMDVAGVPVQPGLLWVGTREGVYRSDDGGQSYQPPMSAAASEVHRLVYEPVNAEIWAALHDEGVWTSGDEGESWEPRNSGLGAFPSTDVAVSPLDAGIVASMSNGALTHEAQVVVSATGGLDWTLRASPRALQGHAVRFGPSGRLYATQAGYVDSTLMRRESNGVWQSIGFARPGGVGMSLGDMNFGATEDTLLAAARLFHNNPSYNAYRLWRSGNGGQTWQAVLEGAADGRFARIERTMGPDGLRLFVLERSTLPDVSGHLWASDDDGQTWFDASTTLPAGMWQQYCTGDNGEVVFTHSENLSGEYQMFRSTDGGDTWMQTDWSPGPHVPGAPFTAMHCPGNAQHVFLGGATGRLLQSRDGGNSVEVVLATDATWGETRIEKIERSPAGLYVAHGNGVWVNPDITPPTAGPKGLVVSRTQSRMRYHVALEWHDGTARVDIRRDGSVLATVDNVGQWSTPVLASGAGSTWQVCDAGTQNCSMTVADN